MARLQYRLLFLEACHRLTSINIPEYEEGASSSSKIRSVTISDVYLFDRLATDKTFQLCTLIEAPRGRPNASKHPLITRLI